MNRLNEINGMEVVSGRAKSVFDGMMRIGVGLQWAEGCIRGEERVL